MKNIVVIVARRALDALFGHWDFYNNYFRYRHYEEFERNISGAVRKWGGVEFQIETTNYCNAHCSFCPNATLRRERRVMDMQMFGDILDKIEEEEIPVKRFYLHINGEPLLDPFLADRVSLCKERFPAAAVEITSNFSLADKTLMKSLIDSGLDKIIISLNSLDPALYHRTMGLDYYRTHKNFDDFLKLREELKSDIEVAVSLVTLSLDDKTVEEFKEKYEGIAEVRVMCLGQWVNEDVPDNIAQSRNGLRRVGSCPLLYHTVNILSNGDYALCCFDAEGIIHRNIYDGKILDIWASGVFEQIRKYQRKSGRTNKECFNCSFNE